MIAALNGQAVLDLAGIPELQSHGAAGRIEYQGLCW